MCIRDSIIDSTINTRGTRFTKFQRAGVNFNGRHSFTDGSELAADIDVVKFDIDGSQHFQTQLDAPGSAVQATRGTIPSRLHIFTAKSDYSRKFKQLLWETGLKTATTNTCLLYTSRCV